MNQELGYLVAVQFDIHQVSVAVDAYLFQSDEIILDSGLLQEFMHAYLRLCRSRRLGHHNHGWNAL